jgi:retron-type reverse transcriptase
MGTNNQNKSCAVSALIGSGLRGGDVDSTIRRSTLATLTMHGFRTSRTATRITTTRTTPTLPAPSADQYARHHADFSFTELTQAYFDCRRNKRNKHTALAFELHLERNLRDLYDELVDGSYQPGLSITFNISRPKPREVWAAAFRDRVVQHLLYNKVSPRFHASFIADSCACIPERGTLYGAERLEAKVRSITQNWSKPTFYLKLDLANFFVSINKNIVRNLLAKKITEPWWMELAETILFHDPRTNYEFHGDPSKLNKVPAHKRLLNQTSNYGLPIGNVWSQFVANVLLNVLDQFCKHQMRIKHYFRYVDDIIILHEDPKLLNNIRVYLEAWLPHYLDLRINPSKTILQPIERGVDFVGQVIKPWHRYTRRRTFNDALHRVATAPEEGLFETANSYFGLFRQATHSHHDRARLANVLRKRGFTVNHKLTKIYRKRVPA